MTDKPNYVQRLREKLVRNIIEDKNLPEFMKVEMLAHVKKQMDLIGEYLGHMELTWRRTKD